MIRGIILKEMTTQRISLLILGLILFFIYEIPIESIFQKEEITTTCLHKGLLGFGCPGCGMTRAIHSFLHFNFKAAANFNFAIFGLFPLLISQSLYQLSGNKKMKLIQKNTLLLFLFLLSSQYILRIISNQ